MRIAVITFHRALNVGAALQAYALRTVLKRCGHEVVFPDCNRIGLPPRFQPPDMPFHWPRGIAAWARYLQMLLLSLGTVDLKRFLFWRFAKRHFRMVRVRGSRMDLVCEAAVFGGDQIWNLAIGRSDTDPDGGVAHFLGERCPEEFPRISYAASIGDRSLPPADKARLAASVRLFRALSVREDISGEGVTDVQGHPAALVVDPSLLLRREDYLAIARPGRMKRGRYALMYVLSPVPFACQCAKTVERELGLPVVILAMDQFGLKWCPKNVRIAFGPEEWLAWFRDAECVLSMSFHGTAFSLIFGKPFVSAWSFADRRPTRIETLLRGVGELDRIVTPGTDPVRWLPLLRMAPCEESQNRLAAMRKESLRWLESGLSKCECESSGVKGGKGYECLP